MKNQPLFLPAGSVRSLIALGLLLLNAGIASYLVTQHIDAEITQLVVGGQIAGFGNAIGFYFGSRSANGGTGP